MDERENFLREEEDGRPLCVWDHLHGNRCKAQRLPLGEGREGGEAGEPVWTLGVQKVGAQAGILLRPWVFFPLPLHCSGLGTPSRWAPGGDLVTIWGISGPSSDNFAT